MAQLSILHSHPAGYELLKEELHKCGLEGKDFDAVFSFLTRHDTRSLREAGLETVIAFRNDMGLRYREKQAREHYMGLLEIALMRFLQPSFPQLNLEINGNHHFSRAEGNKARTFLMIKGIRKASEITFRTRAAYEHFLSLCCLKDIRRYLKVLDQIKLCSIKVENEKRPFPRKQLRYENDVVFLGYHPDYETAMDFYYVQNKEELVFDLVQS